MQRRHKKNEGSTAQDEDYRLAFKEGVINHDSLSKKEKVELLSYMGMAWCFFVLQDNYARLAQDWKKAAEALAALQKKAPKALICCKWQGGIINILLELLHGDINGS